MELPAEPNEARRGSGGLDEETIRAIGFARSPGAVLGASFTCEIGNPAYGAGRVALYVYAVPSAESMEIQEALLDHGLPLLRSWLDHAERAGSTWRATSHWFSLRYVDGALRAASD